MFPPARCELSFRVERDPVNPNLIWYRDMERLRIVKVGEIEAGWNTVQRKTTDSSDRLKAVVRDLTEKALQIVNRNKVTY